jgi:hypothetical protein
MARIDDYETIIRRDGATFLAGVPQLGLYARADSAGAALQALEAKKSRLAADIEAVGALAPFPDPAPSPPSVRYLDTLGLFAAKAAIVFLFLGVAVAASGAVITARVHSAVLDMIGSDTVGGAQFWTKLEQDLQKAADPSGDLPEQKKQQLLANIKVLVNRWRPFVAAVAPLFATDGGAGAPAASSQPSGK